MFDMSQFEKENLKDNFFQLMLEYPYTQDQQRKKQLLQKAQEFTQKVPEFKGWPHNDKAFWNAEAFMWNSKINPQLREKIKQELIFRVGNKNLDLGAGSITYTPHTIALDYSPEMLKHSDAPAKVIHNLEKPLPFPAHSFDSVSAVFILNYIENLPQLIQETHKVLKVNGKLTIVQPEEVNDLYQLHVKNRYQEAELRILLKKAGFKTDSHSKIINNQKTTFFFCQKLIR